MPLWSMPRWGSSSNTRMMSTRFRPRLSNSYWKGSWMDQTETLDGQSSRFVENMLSFINILRRAGLPVSTNQVLDFVRALRLIDIGQRVEVYHAARGILVNRYDHLRLFDTLFNTVWNAHAESLDSLPQKAPRAPRYDQEYQTALVAYMARKAQPHDPEVDFDDKSGTYSDLEVLQRRDFSEMTL